MKINTLDFDLGTYGAEDDTLGISVSIDGVPWNDGSPRLGMSDLVALAVPIEQNCRFVAFNTCSCGVAGCSNDDEFEMTIDDGVITILDGDKQLYKFNQSAVRESALDVLDDALRVQHLYPHMYGFDYYYEHIVTGDGSPLQNYISYIIKTIKDNPL